MTKSSDRKQRSWNWSLINLAKVCIYEKAFASRAYSWTSAIDSSAHFWFLKQGHFAEIHLSDLLTYKCFMELQQSF